MLELRTERLRLRPLERADAPFILELVNDPDWIRFIGDRQMRTLEQAEQYIVEGPKASYEEHGFGLLAVTLRETDTSVGICGLIRRPTLDDVDLGFALLSDHRGHGYSVEASRVVLTSAADHGLTRVVAITDPENTASRRVLEQLGFQGEGTVPTDGEANDLELYGLKLSAHRNP